jgi:hypothetical protein
MQLPSANPNYTSYQQQSDIVKTDLSPGFAYYMPYKKRSAIQQGIKRPVFLLVNSAIPDFTLVHQLSGNTCQKMPQ